MGCSFVYVGLHRPCRTDNICQHAADFPGQSRLSVSTVSSQALTTVACATKMAAGAQMRLCCCCCYTILLARRRCAAPPEYSMLLKSTPTREAVRLTLLAERAANLSAGLPFCMWACMRWLVTKPPLACRTHTSGPQAITACATKPSYCRPTRQCRCGEQEPKAGSVCPHPCEWSRTATACQDTNRAKLQLADMKALRHAGLCAHQNNCIHWPSR